MNLQDFKTIFLCLLNSCIILYLLYNFFVKFVHYLIITEWLYQYKIWKWHKTFTNKHCMLWKIPHQESKTHCTCFKKHIDVHMLFSTGFLALQ